MGRFGAARAGRVADDHWSTQEKTVRRTVWRGSAVRAMLVCKPVSDPDPVETTGITGTYWNKGRRVGPHLATRRNDDMLNVDMEWNYMELLDPHLPKDPKGIIWSCSLIWSSFHMFSRIGRLCWNSVCCCRCQQLPRCLAKR